MISESQNQALLMVASKAASNPLWIEYAEYCRLREQGLRKQSFEKLNEFINKLNSFSNEQQLEFVIFIYELAENVRDADYGPLPTPLAKILEKILLRWIEKEDKDSRPFRWLAKYFYKQDFIERALEIDPSDDKARFFVINSLLSEINNSTHHLPSYYIGEPHQDFQRESLAINHINKLEDGKRKKYWTNELHSEMELVKSYADWQKAKSDLDFKSWAMQNGREFDSGIIAIYYNS